MDIIDKREKVASSPFHLWASNGTSEGSREFLIDTSILTIIGPVWASTHQGTHQWPYSFGWSWVDLYQVQQLRFQQLKFNTCHFTLDVSVV